jgi:hypothetical protein
MTNNDFIVVKHKKNKNRKIKGAYFQHTFKFYDNWDGTFCPDYCIGCGNCSCFCRGIAYIIFGYKQHVRITNYYCNLCCSKDNANINTLSRNEVSKHVDIEIKNGYIVDAQKNIHIICKQCNKKTNDYTIRHIYQTRIACPYCGNNNRLRDLSYEVCFSKKYDCHNCHTSYNIMVNNNEMIKCEELTKIEKVIIIQKWFKRILLGRKLLKMIPRLAPLYYDPEAKGGYFHKKKMLKFVENIN